VWHDPFHVLIKVPEGRPRPLQFVLGGDEKLKETLHALRGSTHFRAHPEQIEMFQQWATIETPQTYDADEFVKSNPKGLYCPLHHFLTRPAQVSKEYNRVAGILIGRKANVDEIAADIPIERSANSVTHRLNRTSRAPFIRVERKDGHTGAGLTSEYSLAFLFLQNMLISIM